MSGALTKRRKRSPFGDDLRIVISGVWGFVLQSFKTLLGWKGDAS